MSDSRRLLVATLVLIVGVLAAFAIPPGTCSQGELVEDSVESETYTCRVMYDVFVAARSLIVLKYVTAVVSVLVAAAVAAPVVVRRRRESTRVAERRQAHEEPDAGDQMGIQRLDEQ
jgi:hypothetical protein